MSIILLLLISGASVHAEIRVTARVKNTRTQTATTSPVAKRRTSPPTPPPPHPQSTQPDVEVFDEMNGLVSSLTRLLVLGNIRLSINMFSGDTLIVQMHNTACLAVYERTIQTDDLVQSNILPVHSIRFLHQLLLDAIQEADHFTDLPNTCQSHRDCPEICAVYKTFPAFGWERVGTLP